MVPSRRLLNWSDSNELVERITDSVTRAGGEATVARNVFFSFLGTNNYVPVRYSLREHRTAGREKFVQAALVDCLRKSRGTRLDVARIAVTRDARGKHWAQVQARLAELGVDAEPLDIPDGASERELWTIFSTVGQALGRDDAVTFDLTHGFRSLPAAGLMAMTFFRHTLNVQVEVYYGAFEVLGTLRDVERRAEAEPGWLDQVAAPFFDLTPMFVLPTWAEAVAEWQRTGRSDGIVERTKPHADALKRELKAHAPKALTSLPLDLQLLGDALALVRQDKIGRLAQVVVDGSREARNEVVAEPALAPLAYVLAAIEESVAPLCGPGDEWADYGDAYLRHQVEIGRWMALHGRIVEGFSFAREIIISCAVRIALAAGVDRIGDRPPTHKDCRSSADGVCALLASKRSGQDVRESEQVVASHIAPWMQAHPQAALAYKAAYEATQAHRNRLDHCWTSDEHAGSNAPKHNRDTGRLTAAALLKAVANASALVDAVRNATREPEPAGRAMSEPGGRQGCFINLSNHPIRSWSEAQVEAAKALGLGDAVELEGGMPEVAPEADEAEVAKMVQRVAERAVAAGARGHSWPGSSR